MSSHSRSSDYDQIRKGYSPGLIKKIVSTTRTRGHALDLATGTGLIAFQLADHFKQVTGADSSPERIKMARKTAKTIKTKTVPRFLEAKAEKLPFHDETFDLVTIAQAFHWFDPAKSLREINRVLKPGGTVAILWKYPKANSKTARVTNQVLKGFRRDMRAQVTEACDPALFARTGFLPPMYWEKSISYRYSVEDWAKSVTWAAGAGSGEMTPDKEEALRLELMRRIRKISPGGVWEPFVQYLFCSKSAV